MPTIAQTTTMTSLLQCLAAAAKLSLVLILFLPACTVYWLPTECLVKTTFSRRLNAAHSILFDTRHAGAKGHDSFSETVTYVSFASGRNSASPRPLQTHSTKERVETAEVTLDSARRTKRQTKVHGNASSQQTVSTTNNISTTITTQQTPMGNVCTLMTTRTTGDLLDDADADFIREGQLWMTDSSIKNETRPILKQITEDGMISKKAYRTFSRVVRYVSYLLILVGLVTNGIALKVFRRMPGTVTNTYMKCLIIFDVAYLLSVVSSYIIVAALKDHVDGSIVHYLYSLHTYLILGARQVIVCATTFMCLDRFLALACPLKRVKIVVLKNPKPLVAAVSVVIFLYNSHKLLKREIKSGVFSDTNQTMSYLGYTQIYAENRRLIDDLTIASTIMFQYLPLIVMTAANISLVASLHKYSRRASAVELQIKRTFRLRQVSKESDTSSTSSNSEAKPAVTSVSPRVFDIQNETPKQMNLIKTRSNSLECNGQASDGFRQKLTKSRSNSYDGETDKSTEKAPNSFENKDKILNGLKFKVTKSRSNSLQKGERTHRERKSNASKSLQFFQIERHKSVTVIVYSILFLLLALPLALFPLLQRLAPEFDAFKREHYLFLVYTRVISLLHIISASINFFVFFIKGRAFRSGVHKVCRCEHNGKKRETFRIQPTKTAVLDGSA